MARHYSPRTRVVLFRSNEEALVCGEELRRQDLSWGWLSFGDPPEECAAIAMPREPEEYSARLYRELHAFDEVDIDRILVTLPPETPEWAAVRDRLRRAAASGEIPLDSK
jgi:L-threonylcarbamoyladenylate synthase